MPQEKGRDYRRFTDHVWPRTDAQAMRLGFDLKEPNRGLRPARPHERLVLALGPALVDGRPAINEVAVRRWTPEVDCLGLDEDIGRLIGQSE